MKKSSVKDQGKPDETDPRDDDRDIRDKMKKIDVKSSSSANSSSSMAKGSALLPGGVARVKQQEAGRINQTGSSSGSATGNPRNKTALAPGHSLMDWIRLGNSGADLTGVGGVPRVVTLSELASHNKKNDAWIAIRGIVFNVTRYMDFHPGGIDELMRGVGKDATKLFESVHAWVNYQSILQKCVVGRLSRGSASGTSPSPTENTVSNTADCSSATLNQITSCTTHSASQENASDSGLSSIKMEWKQTVPSVTFFYKIARHCPGLGYELLKRTNSNFIIKLLFDDERLVHKLDLVADVEWPPTCTRNFETMEVEFTFIKRQKMPWMKYGTQLVTKDITTDLIYRDYEVVANEPLSSRIHMLIVRAKDFLQIVHPGRHVKLKLNNFGNLSRSYTPVPPCLHPDDMPPNYTTSCLCFIVKNYPNGTMSPSITALEQGETLALSGAVGDFSLELYDCFSVIHILAAGTGLTAMLGIIQRSLGKQKVKAVNLLCFNEDEESMFYHQQLEKVSGQKLKVTHILAKPKDTWTGRRGLITPELLEELIGENIFEGCVFTCGPPLFMQTAKTYLSYLQWSDELIYEFSG
ncbi:cytochrome b5 reductase 4 isoform X2 [Frieseomelitta varia]|uniref:cytochrome b5 reductase 4 isoform X2 n=1 Tax=Frieseomelitta varia TaxID=561572 RepID=UPI001CB6A4D2|nr:cytochrome b5 reductase 4 isoform X2 [Frieseomelitta varia]